MEDNKEYPYVVSTKFKNSNKVYTFETDDNSIVSGEYVVVNTVGGLELAEVVSDTLSKENVKVRDDIKPIVRKATPEDRSKYQENKVKAKQALEICSKIVDDLNLDMNLISADYVLDRTKILIIYVADDRVDFRELLKLLASKLHCRIELKQIGSRDKAQMIGGLGICGMETCCSRFMNNFEIISINMAKNQGLALNNSKISGQCGKLLCCLKHENDVYKEKKQGIPKINTAVTYNNESYRIASISVIKEELTLSNREDAIVVSFNDFKSKAVVASKNKNVKKGE
ncbi:MAG: stage 0 sporulation family protein [Anaerorhabdus sp.]